MELEVKHPVRRVIPTLGILNTVVQFLCSLDELVLTYSGIVCSIHRVELIVQFPVKQVGTEGGIRAGIKRCDSSWNTSMSTITSGANDTPGKVEIISRNHAKIPLHPAEFDVVSDALVVASAEGNSVEECSVCSGGGGSSIDDKVNIFELRRISDCLVNIGFNLLWDCNSGVVSRLISLAFLGGKHGAEH